MASECQFARIGVSVVTEQDCAFRLMFCYYSDPILLQLSISNLSGSWRWPAPHSMSFNFTPLLPKTQLANCLLGCL